MRFAGYSGGLIALANVNIGQEGRGLMAQSAAVASLVTPALGESVALEDVTITPAGRRKVVRITLDRPVDSAIGDTPVEPLTLEELAEATRTVSAVLDGSEVLGSQPYVLEVTSPGVSRPLTEPIHFRRNIGRLVEIIGPEQPTITARVLATDEGGVDLEVPATDKSPARPERREYADIARGQVQVEFNRPDATT